MNRVLIITSIVTAVAVLAYTVFAGLQWWAIRKQSEYASRQVGKMQEQLDAMKEQAIIMGKQYAASEAQMNIAEIATRAAERSAKAAEDSAKHAEEGLRISQRAYVGLKMHPIIQWRESGLPIVLITFTNTGNTPARKVELWFEFQVGTEIFEDRKKGFTISAHTDKSLECEWMGDTLDKEQRSFIESNEYVMFFWALLRYTDAWDEIQDPVELRYTYNPQMLALEEYYEGEKRHQREDENWNSAVDPKLGE